MRRCLIIRLACIVETVALFTWRTAQGLSGVAACEGCAQEYQHDPLRSPARLRPCPPGLVRLTRAVRALGVILETQTSVLHELTVHLDTGKGS